MATDRKSTADSSAQELTAGISPVQHKEINDTMIEKVQNCVSKVSRVYRTNSAALKLLLFALVASSRSLTVRVRVREGHRQQRSSEQRHTRTSYCTVVEASFVRCDSNHVLRVLPILRIRPDTALFIVYTSVSLSSSGAQQGGTNGRMNQSASNYNVPLRTGSLSTDGILERVWRSDLCKSVSMMVHS